MHNIRLPSMTALLGPRPIMSEHNDLVALADELVLLELENILRLGKLGKKLP